MFVSGHARAPPASNRRGIVHHRLTRGAITFGDIADRLPMLNVAARNANRRGRLSVAKLIAEHGADMRLPDLREILAGDCPRVRATSFNDRRAVHYPQLVSMGVG